MGNDPIGRDWMRCGIGKRATMLLCLAFSAAMAADYSVNVSYEGDQLYSVIRTGMTQNQSCKAVNEKVSFSATSLDRRSVYFYSDKKCKTLVATIATEDLFKEGNSVSITLSENGDWAFSAAPAGPQGPGENPEEPKDDPQEDPRDNPQQPARNSVKYVSFLTPWTNTNAVLFVNGDSVSTMSSVNKYCGWYVAAARAPSEGFNVYFKQTIGPYFVGAEGLTKTEPTMATEISLDSVAALSDTIWVKGNQEGAPEVYSEHPAGVLGDCPLKKLPVMMFDWLHGDKGDGTRGNGNPENGVSADFGSGGCSASPMKGMVATQLGSNGVPVSADPFPTNCKITEHLDSWFLPEVLAKDDAGNEYTNMTCRDLYISMDDEGFWLAEISKDRISEGNEVNKGGMFLLDDFQYLDTARTIPNPYYDNLSGGSDNGRHNFGFTMKIQATFEYVPGQYFDFLGDDDVWVFINNKLVVDIGGQHAQVRGAVDLDTLGLIPDSTYNFHIFYAERHQSSSNFRMRTSIDLKTDASIVLRNGASESTDMIVKEVWQRVRKNKLACDFSSAGTEVALERGRSTFVLMGGNLPSNGVELDTAGTWFGGITIGSGFDEFKIDKEAIKNDRALTPGVYHVQVTLVSDNSKHKDVYFVVDPYELPSIVYTDGKGNILGTDVVSDTLPLNLDPTSTMWAGQTYQVHIQYDATWATTNDVVYLFSNDSALVPCDADGKPITELTLDSGKAVFYVKAMGKVENGSIWVKGRAAANTAVWDRIFIEVPPVPQIETAYIFDRNGDGRGDSIWVKFDDLLGGKNSLDSARFTFGKAFETTFKPQYARGDDFATITAEGDGFGTAIFTGGEDSVYTGILKLWFTYTENGESSVFPGEGWLRDSIGPVITAAEISYMSDGNAELIVSFSERLKDEDANSSLFRFHCWKDGVQDSLVKNTNEISTENTRWIMIFPKGGDNDVVPAVGDSIRFIPPSQGETVFDFVGVRPHENNAWVRITGEQKVQITSPGVVTLDPGSPSYDSAKVIIRSSDATVPKLVQSDQVLSANQVAAIYGTQGHYLGDLDMAELVQNEIADIVKAVQSTSSYTDSEDESGRTYTIDEIIRAVDAGAMSIGEAEDRFDLDPVIVDAYKNGMLTGENVYKFARGSQEDIQEIVEAVAENTELYYKTTYYSSLGEFVNSNSETITCNSEIFKSNGQGTCLDNAGRLFLAWNMRAKNGRLVSTGVYIARLEYRIRVGSKTIVDRGQDFLWGFRRGKANAQDLGI